MTNQSRLHYLTLFVRKVSLQVLAPKCPVAKLQSTVSVSDQGTATDFFFSLKRLEEAVKMVQKSINDYETKNPIKKFWGWTKGNYFKVSMSVKQGFQSKKFGGWTKGNYFS